MVQSHHPDTYARERVPAVIVCHDNDTDSHHQLSTSNVLQ